MQLATLLTLKISQTNIQFMKTYTLKEFTEEHSQSVAAEVLGCTQGNISHTLASDRQVFITEDDDGARDFYEINRGRYKRSKSGSGHHSI